MEKSNIRSLRKLFNEEFIILTICIFSSYKGKYLEELNVCLTLFVARGDQNREKGPPMRFKKNNNNSYHVYSSTKPGSDLFCKISFCPSEGNLEEQYQFEWKTEDEKIRRQIIREWKSKQKKIPFLTILCEGKTELIYLSEIIKILGLTNNVAISSYNGGDPKVQFIPATNNFLWQKQFKHDFNQELWFVFDKDDHPGYKSLTEMPKINSDGIFLAWSNPCIEYWFLLHSKKFKDEDLPRTQKEEIERKSWVETGKGDHVENVLTQVTYQSQVSPEDCFAKLRSQSRGYSKTSPDLFHRFSPHLPFALNNCKNRTNPAQHGSVMPLLIERLIKYSPYSRTAALKLLSNAKPAPKKIKAPPSQWSTKEFNRFKTLAGTVQSSKTISDDNSEFMVCFLKKLLTNISQKTKPEIIKNYFPN